MSTVGSTLLACPDVQAELTSFFNTCGHVGHRESPFLQFITSGENQTGINQVINPGGGKNRTLVLRYDQKIAASAIQEVSSCALNCSSDNKVGDMSKTYDMDPCEKLEYSEGYTWFDLISICRDNETFLMSRINAAAMALEARIAQKTAEESVDLIGAWATDVEANTGLNLAGSVLEVPTLLTGTQNLNPRFTSKIRGAMDLTGYCGDRAIFGSYQLWEATDNLNIGCCASTGLDLFASLQRYGTTTMFDSYVTAAYGSALMSIATQLQALQLLVFTVGRAANFSPIVGPAASNFEVIPMTTPRYGIPFDLTLSNNCGEFSFTVSTSTKLVDMPIDMFPVGDVQEGVNFVNQIQVTNS